MGTDRSADLDSTADDVTYCARHPRVETTLRCGRCNTLICPRCLVQTPVGARCPDCANVRRLPTIDVSPLYLLRGGAAALVAGIVIGFAWGYLLGGGGGLVGFFTIFLGMGIGWAVGEAISVATNRKRSPVLQGFAVAAVILAYLTRNVSIGAPLLPQGDLWGYVAAIVAAVYASSRLSR